MQERNLMIARVYNFGRQVADKYKQDEMTVYAAQASFFITLSVFPFMMVLLTVVQLVPSLGKEDLAQVALAITPNLSDSVQQVVANILNDLYTRSPGTILSITAVTALWSASKGMLSIERGLDRIHRSQEKRGYIISRLMCSGYTILFLMACILCLLLLVFGNLIQNLVLRIFPFLSQTAAYIINFRTLWALTLLTFCFTGLYTIIPFKKLSFRSQLPGAIFCTLCWIGFSFGFSIYFNHFSNYSYMYGSLTAIVLMMLWLYFCVCILFLGAELNYFLDEKSEP